MLSTFRRPKALLTTVSGDLKSQCLFNGIFFKVKNFVFVTLKSYLHSVTNKKKPLYVFLLCVKYKIVFNLIYDSLNLFLIKQTLDSDCTIDAISLGEKNGQWEKELKGDTFLFRLQSEQVL